MHTHECTVTSGNRCNRGHYRSNLSSIINGMVNIRVDSVQSLKFGYVVMSQPSIQSIAVIFNQQLVELGTANLTFFSCSVGHNFLHIDLFTNIKAFMDSIDMQQLKYELSISCLGIYEALAEEKQPFFIKARIFYNGFLSVSP